jgi:hypothetical protein
MTNVGMDTSSLLLFIVTIIILKNTLNFYTPYPQFGNPIKVGISTNKSRFYVDKL